MAGFDIDAIVNLRANLSKVTPKELEKAIESSLTSAVSKVKPPTLPTPKLGNTDVLVKGIKGNVEQFKKSFGDVAGTIDKTKKATEGVVKATGDVGKTGGPVLRLLNRFWGENSKSIRGSLVSASSLTRALQVLGLQDLPLGKTFARFAGLTAAAKDAAPALEQMGVVTRGAGGAITGMNTATLAAAGAFAAAAVAAVAMLAIIRSGLRIWSQTERLLVQIESSLDAAGEGFGRSISQIRDFAHELSLLHGISNNIILQIVNIGTSFEKVTGESFERGVEEALDLMTKFQRGTVESAKSVFLALQDPIKGLENLSEVGIRFSEYEKAAIKAAVAAGQFSEAQGLVLDVLDQVTDDASEAVAGTLSGTLGKFRALIEKGLEGIGELVAPVIKDLVDFGASVFRIFKALGPLLAVVLLPMTKIFLAVKIVAKFLKILALAVELVVIKIREFIENQKALQQFFSIAGKVIGFVGKAIGGLENALEKAVGQQKEQNDELKEEQRLRRKQIQQIEDVKDAIEAETEAKLDANDAERDRATSIINVAKATREAGEAERIHQGILNGFPKTSKEYKDALDDLEDARKSHKEAEEDITDAEEDHRESLEDLSEAQEKFKNISEGYARDSEEATEAVEELSDALREAREAQLDLEKSTINLSKAQRQFERDQKIFAKVIATYGANSKFTAIAQDELAISNLNLQDAQLDLEKSQDKVGDTQKEAADAQEKANSVLNGYKETSKEYKEALKDLKDAQEDVRDAEKAISEAREDAADALEDLTEKEKEYQDVVNGYPTTSLKYIKAQEDMKLAMIDLARAEDDAQRAHRDNKQAIEDLGNAAAITSGKIKDLVSEINPIKDIPFVSASVETVLEQLIKQNPDGALVISARAEGGPLRARQAALVGEEGPELFIPNTAGFIVPAANPRSISASSFGGGESTEELRRLIATLQNQISVLNKFASRPIEVTMQMNDRVLGKTLVPSLRRSMNERF